MTTQNDTRIKKSEILFLYESKYSLPNGDPFTGEQRYDGETKKILVSDVRIKRFIRDYLINLNEEVYVVEGESAGQTSEVRMKFLKKKYADDESVKTRKVVDDAVVEVISELSKLKVLAEKNKNIVSGDLAQIQQTLSKMNKKPEKALREAITKYAQAKDDKKKEQLPDLLKLFKDYADGKSKPTIDAKKVLQKCIDVRLFGGISTEEGDTANLTGPVQFALLNPSCNRVDLRMHQNTSHFVSKVGYEQGAIATTTLVPYSLNQIHGWINPYSADETNLTQHDINLMFSTLWHSVNNANTRSKSNQDSLLLLQIVYREPHRKIYGVDRLIKLEPKEKQEEQIRCVDDYALNFGELEKKAANDAVEKVYYYTEHDELQNQFTALGGKFELMKLETL